MILLQKEILEELKGTNCHDLEDLVYRMEITHDEIMDVLDKNYFSSKRTGYTLPARIYELNDINKTLKF